MKKLVLFIGALFSLCVFAEELPSNIVVNSDMSKVDGNGVAEGWTPGWAKSSDVQGKKVIIIDGTAEVKQLIDIKPEWAKLKLSMKMKATGVTVGDQDWKDARNTMRFLDKDGKMVGEWPNIFHASGTTDWQSCERDYDVPAGAVKLEFGLANFGSAGKVEFEDIKLSVSANRK